MHLTPFMRDFLTSSEFKPVNTSVQAYGVNMCGFLDTLAFAEIGMVNLRVRVPITVTASMLGPSPAS